MSNELVKTKKNYIKGERKENLKQRAYLNSLTSIIDYVATQLTGFIVSPFIVNGLGSSMYGIWQMLGQMTGYAKVADTRATQVLKWTVAKKKDVVSEDELRSDVSSALVITAFIVPIILVVGGVVAWYSPLITKADVKYHDLIRITCSLLILSLVVSKLFDLFESVLRGMNLSFKRMGLRAITVIVGGGLKVLVITMGYGLIGLSIVHLIIAFIIGITYYIVVKQTVGWFGLGKTNFKRIKSFSKISGWYLADTGANVLIGNSDKILLGFITSPVLVTYYGLTLFLPTAFQGLINRVVMGVVPGIGKLLGLQEYDKIIKALRNINNITFLLATASGTTIILFNQSFLNIWVGEEYFAGNIANTLIMLMIVQDTFIKHDAYVISATLDLKKKVFLTILSGLVFASLGFLLIYKLEIIGICISLIVGKFVLFLGQRNILNNKIKNHLNTSTLHKLQPVIVCISMIVTAGYIASISGPFTIWQMVILIPLTFIVSLVIFYIVGLRNSSRRELENIILSIKLFKSD